MEDLLYLKQQMTIDIQELNKLLKTYNLPTQSYHRTNVKNQIKLTQKYLDEIDLMIKLRLRGVDFK